MSVVSRTLVLTGAHEGKTIKLGDVQFVNGKVNFTLPEKDAEGLTKYLGRSYQAYPKDSIELAKVQNRGSDGKRGVQTDEDQGTSDEVLSDDKSSGQRTSEVKPVVSVGSTKTEERP